MKGTAAILRSHIGVGSLRILVPVLLVLAAAGAFLFVTSPAAAGPPIDDLNLPVQVEETRDVPKRVTRDVQGQGASITQTSTTPTPRTLVSNTGQANSAAATAWDQDRALGFTTGGNEDGYRLTSVDVVFSVAADEPLNDYRVRIVNAGNNQPGNTNKGTLKSVPLPVAGVNSFTGNVDPDANTTYYFFLDLDLGDGFDAARMRMTSSTGKDSGGLSDWSIGDSFARAPKGFWLGKITQRVKIKINGYAIVKPTLDSAEVNGTTMVLTFDQNLETTSRTAARQFGIKFGGGALQNATAISISGNEVTLTVPEVRAGQVVTVSYTKPTRNPLKGTNDEEVVAISDQDVTVNTGPAYGSLPEGSEKVRDARYVTYTNADGEEETVENRAASADRETLYDYFYDSCSARRSLSNTAVAHDYSQHTYIVWPPGSEPREVMTQARNGWKWVWTQDPTTGAVTGTRPQTLDECASLAMYHRQAFCRNLTDGQLPEGSKESTCPTDRTW